jgi:hypothetical protein
VRSEDDVRNRLALELMAYTQHESQDSVAARANHERIRLLEWILTPTESEIPPPPSGNGAP